MSKKNYYDTCSSSAEVLSRQSSTIELPVDFDDEESFIPSSRFGGNNATMCEIGPEAELLRHLNDTVDLLQPAEKAAYLEASRRAPLLVQKESNPMWFIRHEKMNAWSAAKRLSSYWRFRRDLFGSDNFIKPMHQTGNGALSTEEITILETGFLCILPKISATGQQVLLWDRDALSRSQCLQTRERLKATFYIFQLLMEGCSGIDVGAEDHAFTNRVRKSDDRSGNGNESSHHPVGSIVCLCLASASLSTTPDFEYSRIVIDMVRRGFAICTDSIHLVSFSSKRGTVLWSTLAAVYFDMLGSYFGQVAKVQIGNTVRELQQKLLDSGFEKKCLPTKLGGTWNFERFKQFIRRRRKIEDDMFLSDDERLKRKRQVNMIHSRQKRERRKIEFEVIQEQCDELVRQNSMLRNEIKRTEESLKQAQSLVQVIEQQKIEDQSSSTCPVRAPTLPFNAMTQNAFAQQPEEYQIDPFNIDRFSNLIAMGHSIPEQENISEHDINAARLSLHLQHLVSAEVAHLARNREILVPTFSNVPSILSTRLLGSEAGVNFPWLQNLSTQHQMSQFASTTPASAVQLQSENVRVALAAEIARRRGLYGDDANFNSL